MLNSQVLHNVCIASCEMDQKGPLLVYSCRYTTHILYLLVSPLCNTQGYFCDGTPFRKLFLRTQARTVFRNLFFLPAIDITRLGVSCYPTALLSNKLAQRPLKFQRVMANNSLDFVQFLKTPPPAEFWVTLCVPEPIFFFLNSTGNTYYSTKT
jgi:hypothetical protein